MEKLLINDWKFSFNNVLYKSTVPGDISVDLYKNGLIDDPLFSTNYKNLRWVHEKEWTFYSQFNVTDDVLNNEVVELLFLGVDTYSSVYLNDKLVGKTTSMFRPFSFNVKDVLSKGLNTLKVVIDPIRIEFNKYSSDYHYGTFNHERCFLRKVQCHFGWDWAVDYPGTGIYKPVYLSYGSSFYIDNVQVITNNNGLIDFSVELPFNNKKVNSNYDNYYLKVMVTDDKGNTITNKKEVFGSINRILIKINNPKLWYFNGYGNQPLYRYDVELLNKDEEVCDRCSGKFAIIEIEIKEPLRENGTYGFDFYVNGERNRFVGGNFVPLSPFTGAITKEEYRRYLRTAKEAGINMLRVWGGGLYEADVFYDLADEYGIAIWQDFMFSCEIVPDDVGEFNEEIIKEVRYQLKRLRNHPSIILWCGGNELSNSFKINTEEYGLYLIRTVIPGLVAELDSKRRYLWNSPYSLSDMGNDSSSGDCHKNVHTKAITNENYQNFRDYMPQTLNNFDSECAILGMCRPRSFKKFMDKDKLWPINDLWHERLMSNPFDKCCPDFTTRTVKLVNGFFGSYDSMEDLIKKSQIIQMEILSGEIDYYRSHKINSGILSWMYNDYMGDATWSVVDDEICAKPALYAIKRAGKRKRVSITKEIDGYYVNVINDSKDGLDVTLTVSHENLDRLIHKSFEIIVSLEPFDQTKIKLDFGYSIKNSYIYATITNNDEPIDETIFFYDLWKDKNFKKNIDYKIEYSKERKEALLTIKSKEFSRCVFIDVADETLEAYYSDNYFDMVKGEEKKIIIKCDKEITLNDITVKTFNDEWLD